MLDRAKQVAGAVSQVKNGDTAGGAMEAINAATGTIKGLADNQGTRQTNYDANGSVGKQGAKNASANNNFYANIGVNAGISKSKSTSNSHTESAVVTTMKPLNENSGITYNNVKNIEYQGTQAQGGTFIYNNVANIQKEAVELHNSYTSSSSSRGINAGATIGYGHKIQTTGNGGSISASKSNQNTTETIYQNGNFQNVNEVHNNTGTMTLSGFNQEGGKVTGNIGKVEVVSRQNTSTTTGSSKGMSVGVSSQGIPTSVNVNASKTNGNRAFVDNQSTFVVGEGSNLHVGTVENTGAVIGKEGNSTFKIDTYAGKDIQNYDTMTTTGGSIGVSLGGKPKITNVGFNQDSRDKQGITRNTVVGDVEIAEASGSPINRDVTKANEVTKDVQHSTNINVESQTIEYLTNPGKLKEDIGKAKEEINDIKWAIKESIHDRGDDNRNFFGQLSEVRLDKSLENITSERLIGKTVDTEIAGIFKDAYKDLGYDINIIFSDPKNSPQLLDEKGKPKTGTAYVRDEKGKKIKTIIINGEDPKNATKAGLIGTIVEEGSHVIGKVEGRQRKTGTDEKGLESTGRASNEYFSEKYKDDNPTINIQSDGKDYSNVDFGENVGDDRGACTDGKKTNIGCKGRKQKTWSELTPEEKSVEGEIVSTILNFVPYVGPAKIATEAVIGKDLITNKKMSYLDRVSSVLLQSKFHLGELNPKKIGTKKTKEPHKEKPLRRKEKVGNDRNSVKAKTSENKSPKDIELVEGKDGIFEVRKNEGKKSDTSVSKSNPVTKKEPMRDVTPKVKEPSTKGTPKSPAVKPVTKVEQNTETVKQPVVTSEKPKTVEKSHSQGSNNHNSNKESFNQKTEKNISSQNHHSGFTDEINSTAFTSNRNISASKISNNGVKLDVPKDLKPQITDIAKKGDLQGFKTEEVVNEILKRDPNVELLDSGKYGSNNGFDHVFRNKKTGEIWILDSKQIAKSGNMRVSNKGVDGTRQMSPDWVDNVLDKLDTKNQTRKAIESAINKGKINTGLVGVDRKTGELIFIPTRITNIKK